MFMWWLCVPNKSVDMIKLPSITTTNTTRWLVRTTRLLLFLFFYYFTPRLLNLHKFSPQNVYFTSWKLLTVMNVSDRTCIWYERIITKKFSYFEITWKWTQGTHYEEMHKGFQWMTKILKNLTAKIFVNITSFLSLICFICDFVIDFM